jgi:chemotaxis signal transduction protein
MIEGNTRLTAGRAAALRQEFDRQFAEPERQAAGRSESVLALLLDTAPYAVALADVAQFGRTPPILSVPTRVATFLGLIAVRGVLVPAYDLEALLGHSPCVSKAWMLLHRSAHPVAYLFDDFAGHRQISTSDRVDDAVRDGDTWRPLIALSSLTRNLQE